MSSGGYRPNSGPMKGTKYSPRGTRKQKGKLPADIIADAKKENLDPLTYVLKVMNNKKVDKNRRDRMAIAALPFCHARIAEGKGKKEEKESKAKQAGAGKFAAGRPPLKLVK